MNPWYTLIPVPQCCDELSGADAYMGVEITHPDGEDGTSHTLPVYWRDAPTGRQAVELDSFDPLTIAGTIRCSCGWSGTVTDGVVEPA